MSMKTKLPIRNELICFAIVLVTTIALAWVGSNPTVRVVSPDAVGDTDTLTVPINVKIIQVNTAQGIDYINCWLIEEADADTYISAAEWATRTDIPYTGAEIDDINRTASIVIAELGTDDVTQDSSYYIVLVGKDLNGDFSADTTLIHEVSMDGDANIADSAIAYFTVEGTR